MTFEERPERLRERHEALTQSVEILHRDVLGLTAAGKQTMRNFEIVLDSIKSLENIALSHEHRLAQFERIASNIPGCFVPGSVCIADALCPSTCRLRPAVNPVPLSEK